ncbi:cytidylate kinase-like family protein [[Clostridium] fimetarium]|uniref:Cytidylate kinase n=1 Tax=[Clostridium] fimetarium TaxID=99656 RepID=A0A1I0RT93_9FIRM|nr:cytidylate kinase-like family protein [[Clostridium] fimetarium]SEW44520.1 Cytidylate kinase [[Clostridium] fimetarium]
MKKYTITITRQFGSLGRPIAKKMSEILGIEYYDREIVDEAAKKIKLPVSTVSNQEEIARSNFFYMKLPLGNNTSDIQDHIFDVQRKIITELAEKESCIIVGRCADYILQDKENLMNIYIYAPYENRFLNCVEYLHMKQDVARKMIYEVDKARAAYQMRYAKYLPEDINHRNILIDSSFMGIDATAEYLAQMVKIKFE